jgi:peptidoglycan/xylan/chitin deacetylase (PgdA/CDA1 family)
MSGHQIAVHTWSHPMLTTLTDEEIVAELGWSKKIIKDLLGVTPTMMRPPYGDIECVYTTHALVLCSFSRFSSLAIVYGTSRLRWD